MFPQDVDMPGDEEASVEARALEFLEEPERPRRRARPRFAPVLADTPPTEVITSAGPVAAWRVGSGPAALLVHGSRDDQSLWAPLMEALIARSIAFVAADMPSHGITVAEGYAVDPWAEAMLAMRDQLGPVASVVGHSFGVLASIAAIDRGLAVDRAVMIAAPLPSRPELAAPNLRLRGLELADPPVAARVRQLLDERTRRNAQLGTFDPVESVRGFGMPALIVHGSEDEAWTPAAAALLASSWPGASLMMSDGARHRNVARQAEVVERVADFLHG